MVISYHPDSLERNPLLPAYLKKDNKNAEEQYAQHLKQPFYFKNIIEKKAQTKEGSQTETSRRKILDLCNAADPS
jgi:hypothetical protein